MRTYYKVLIETTGVDALLKKWRNLGWEPTIANASRTTAVIHLDLVTDKNTDPTQFKQIKQVLV